MTLRITVFLLLNFAALGIGGMFTGRGVASDWYAGLHKAPWTPPGWVFGAVWTFIMLSFSVYMAQLWPLADNKKLLLMLYALQWVLNVSWNPCFFYFRQVLPALCIITALTGLTIALLMLYRQQLQLWSLLILPYVLWLCIATSLNAYIWLRN